MEYHFWLILFAVWLAYYASLTQAKRKKRALSQHRRLWNWVLLGSFLISGPLGLLLTFASSSDLRLPAYATILWLHAEAGIVLVSAAVFHLSWHWQYYGKKK